MALNYLSIISQLFFIDLHLKDLIFCLHCKAPDPPEADYFVPALRILSAFSHQLAF